MVSEKYPVMRTTQVPSDEHTLSSWHLASGKQNTYSAIVSISDACCRNRTDTTANDMLSDVLYFTIEDLPPAELLIPHAFLTRTCFIMSLDEISRLDDVNFSGRSENPTCSEAISTPLQSIQTLLRDGNKFFIYSQECSDARFTIMEKSSPQQRIASPEFFHTTSRSPLLGATDDYQIIRRMQRSDETAKFARFGLREDETMFKSNADPNTSSSVSVMRPYRSLLLCHRHGAVNLIHWMSLWQSLAIRSGMINLSKRTPSRPHSVDAIGVRQAYSRHIFWIVIQDWTYDT